MAGHRVDEQLIDGRYARREQLGRGGFGIVWRAYDTLLQRDVAVKEVLFPAFLDKDDQAALREKVLREARAAARLSHPSLVTVFDVVEEEDRPFIVMQLVDAPTLAQRVAREGPMSDREAAAMGEEVLDALTTAHSQGIIHRDVKPANVMISNTGRVQLGDFGIASIIDDPKVTSSGHLAGSPSYMAPEQAQNQPAGVATDLWGLAATLYFAVEGEPPFQKDGAIPTLTSVVADEPRPMRRAGALAPVLRDLLVKDPAARPPTEEVRRRLAEVVAGAAELGSGTQPAEAPTPAPLPAAAPSPTIRFDPPTVAAVEAVAANEPPEVAKPTPTPLRRSRTNPPARNRVPLGTVLLLAVGALLAVVLVAVLAARDTTTNTPSSDATPPGGSEEAVEEPDTAKGVPGSWVSYQDPATGFAISHPSDWSVERNGTLTDFRHPESGAYLRVDYTSSPGPSAEQAWRELEPRFAAENPNYRRIRIAGTTFKGFEAAIWEFTYTGRGVPLRAIDLGFVTGPYGFALNFQTRAADWEDMQDVFEAFKDSFRPPPA